MAPDAPKDATVNGKRRIVGMAKEKKDDSTAEFKYIVKKFAAPMYAHNDVPKDHNINMLNKRCIPSLCENAEPTSAH